MEGVGGGMGWERLSMERGAGYNDSRISRSLCRAFCQDLCVYQIVNATRC